MVNTPFLHDKLNWWGTSVRAAWFDDDKCYYIELLDIEIRRRTNKANQSYYTEVRFFTSIKLFFKKTCVKLAQ